MAVMRFPISGSPLRWVRLFWAACLVALLSGTAWAAPPPPRTSVRVVMDQDYPPFVFRGPGGSLKGILVDQWALWAKRTGVAVQLDALPWGEAQRRMESGEYDVIDTIFSNPERRLRYDFTRPYARLDVPIFFSKDLSGISGPRDLPGFIVAAKRGDNSVEILKAEGVQNFLLFDDYEAIVGAARDGRVKVFTVDEPPALYYLIKMGIQDQFRESRPLYSGEFHRAVRKGDRELLALVEGGFSAIQPAEYQEISQRWYGTPLLSRRELRLTLWIAAVSVGGLGLLLLWIWGLRRMVERRTAELRASHAYARSIFDAVHDAVFIADGEGRILDFNARAIELFGVPRERILGWDLGCLSGGVAPWTLAGFRDRLEAARAGGQALFEWQGALADGRTLPLEVAVRLDGTGPETRFVIAVRDITERKRIAEALHASEQITRTISGNFTNGMIYQAVVEPDGTRRFTYLSDSVAILYGATVAEAVADATLIYRQIHPEDLPGLVEAENRAIQAVATFQHEARVVGPDGQIRWSSFVSTPRPRPDGSIVWDGMEFIITDRKRSEEALREREAVYRSLVRAIPDLIFTFDRAGAYLTIHAPKPEQLYAPEEMLWNRTVTEVLPGTLGPQFLAAIGAALDTNAVQELNYSLTVQGVEKWLETRFAPCEGDRVVAIVRDVTEARQVAERQRRLEGQLQQAQKLDSLGSLAGGVAHDMNNVLGAILVTATANQDNLPPGDPLHRALETIARAATRGGQMVKGLLNFARQTAMEQVIVDLNAELCEVARLLERTTLSKIRLELDLAEGLRPIRGDAGSLVHAFMNLCVNAVDAMAEDGTLILSTRNLDDGQVEAVVADTGTGMAPEVLRRALDPYFTTKEVGKGTGLGLSMVYGIVKAHEGHLEIRSEPGRGTQVVLRFPALAGAAAEPATAPPPRPAGAHPLEVLVVDDDEFLRSSMEGLLEQLGHKATLATCGEDALARLDLGLRPDVVILDMNMPGLGGAGTLPRLRALCPGTPVILATGKADQTALDLVASDRHVTLLAKPFTKGELRLRLDSL